MCHTRSTVATVPYIFHCEPSLDALSLRSDCVSSLMTPPLTRTAGRAHRSYMKCASIENISGNEVYYTMFLILLVHIMLCSKIRCQKSFTLNHISCEICVPSLLFSSDPGSSVRLCGRTVNFRRPVKARNEGSEDRSRCRSCVAHARQSGPESSSGIHVQPLLTYQIVPFCWFRSAADAGRVLPSSVRRLLFRFHVLGFNFQFSL